MGAVALTLGADAAQRWLGTLALTAVSPWHAEISVLAGGDTRFDVSVYAEEWGYAFHHDGRTSWIRVTDVPFVHGRDDYRLLARTPDLLGISALLADLEIDHGVSFQRATASVRTNVAHATEAVREWLLQPLPFSTVKKTVRLCDSQMHAGVRCSRTMGHDGDHEFQGSDGAGQLRWK